MVKGANGAYSFKEEIVHNDHVKRFFEKRNNIYEIENSFFLQGEGCFVFLQQKNQTMGFFGLFSKKDKESLTAD